MNHFARSRGLVVITALTAMLHLLSGISMAHDIPSDVTVHTFIKPEGQRLRLLVRVPLAAMRDVYFPTRGPGYLNLARVDNALRDAAAVWIL
ncbi:MAG TPA: hypothetical protein VG759_22605, partial [Candidatus Angelobacter sp.]|nr:hypothetical protein [Candidatus Angelobacter sp.]